MISSTSFEPPLNQPLSYISSDSTDIAYPITNIVDTKASLIPTKIATVCLRIFDIIRAIKRSFFYERRRMQNPTLFIAGTLLEYHVGQENKFLAALAKIISISRALHSSVQSALKVTRHVKQIVQISFHPNALESHGYLLSYNTTHSWKEARQIAPAFNIPNSSIALLMRKAEILWEKLKELVLDFLQLCERLSNLKDIFFDIDRCEVRDLFLELYDLYSMYDVNDSESLLKELLQMAPEIDYILKVLYVNTSSKSILETIQVVFQHVKEAEKNIHQATTEGLFLVQRTHQIATGIFTSAAHPLIKNSTPQIEYSIKNLA